MPVDVAVAAAAADVAVAVAAASAVAAMMAYYFPSDYPSACWDANEITDLTASSVMISGTAAAAADASTGADSVSAGEAEIAATAAVAASMFVVRVAVGALEAWKRRIRGPETYFQAEACFSDLPGHSVMTRVMRCCYQMHLQLH